MRERLVRVEAIVLKRTDTGEADRLLTVYTPDRGKLRAIAKGARKPTSRKSGHVELFTHVELMLAKGRTLDIVTQADTRDSFIAWRENLERTSYAYYIAELTDQFTEEEIENRAIFDLLLRTLAWLGEPTADPALLTRYFELQLLAQVGYQPELFACVNCRRALEPVEQFFSAEAGGMIDVECMQTQRETIAGHARDAQNISLNALKVLRYLQTRAWETMSALQLSAAVQSEVEMLLQRYIAHHLERNLKSVEFLREVKLTRG